MLVELHCHSTFSDGSEPAGRVAQWAWERGAALFALTDHDCCDGYAESAAVFGDRALRAVELTCHEGGRPVHLLLYDVGDGDWSVLETHLAEAAAARVGRARDIADRLAGLGVPVDIDGICRDARGTVGRPHLAQALVDAGHVASIREAFARFLGDGQAAAPPLARTSVAAGVALARRAGARVSLAHPHSVGDRADEMFAAHRAAGLEAIEAYYGPYKGRERRRWLELAARHQLVVTGGSDFHGRTIPAVPRPGIELPEPHASALCEWLGRDPSGVGRAS